MATRSNPNYILSGRITNRQAEPLAGMVVRAYRRTPKKPASPLGSPAVTDAGGRYKITLPESAFKTNRTNGGPELFIRVSNGEKQLSDSAIKRGARKRLTINLELVP